MDLYINDDQVDILNALDRQRGLSLIKRTSSEYQKEMEKVFNQAQNLIDTVRCLICFSIVTIDRRPV